MGLDDAWEPREDRLERMFNKLADLCKLMFDPENQPPQLSQKDAWECYKLILEDISE